ncbi:MAG TPA: hypothetical protein VLW49_05435 [Gaiellaceae bacterium]|nr:hypothetical protein [Gaiellaceae bacterium]
MSLLDKAKQKAEQAAAKAKEGVEDVQQKRELSQAHSELGKTAFELIEAGEISHQRFEATVAKIRDLNSKLADAPAGASASSDDGGDPSQPPAMPT